MTIQTATDRSAYALATSLLFLMLILLVLSRTLLADFTYAPLLRAFSEAALVGALADWFAVTALFRHPLGLPIPHTAIIPRRKDRIGEALGNFVRENFVNEQVIGTWMQKHSPSTELTRYLSSPENRALVARRMAHLAQDLISSLDDQATRIALSRALSELCLHQVDLAPTTGRLIALLLESDRRDVLFQGTITQFEKILALHGEDLKHLLGKELPWYLPRFVQHRLYQSLLKGVHGFIREVQNDPIHPARREFKGYIKTISQQLMSDERLRAKGRELTAELLSSPGLQGLVEELWSTLKAKLAEATDGDTTPLEHIFAHLFSGIIDTLLSDVVLAKRIDHLLEKIARRVVSDYGEQIVLIISETVQTWKSDTVVQKLEEQFGRDLQFIRVNGTIVGGLVGLVLYLL